jgi:hypothetical protein
MGFWPQIDKHQYAWTEVASSRKSACSASLKPAILGSRNWFTYGHPCLDGDSVSVNYVYIKLSWSYLKGQCPVIFDFKFFS